MKNSSTSTDQIWIVKASERILGPFTISDLAVAVRSKEVGLLDEAKNPNSRWTFIRDLPELQAAVLELANESETIEKTHTAAHTQVSVTKNLDDNLTPTPTMPQPHKPTINVQGKTTSQSQNEFNIKSYGTGLGKSPLPVGRWLLYAALVISFFVALFAFYQKQAWQKQQKNIWTQIQQLYAAKLYERAFQSFKGYQLEIPDQSLHLTRLGFLHLTEGRELVKAKRFFDKSVQLDINQKELMLQNLNGLALYSLYDGQNLQAANYLERAETLEPLNVPTKINQIAVYMTQSKWSEAMKIAKKISTSEPRKSYLIQAIITDLSGQFRSEIPNLLSALNLVGDNSMYLSSESKLMRLRLVQKMGSEAEIKQVQNDFFKDLPAFAMEFSEDPIYDQRWKDWNFLFQFCSEFKSSFDLSPEAVAVQVICKTKVQRWAEAEKAVAEGLIRFPNNSRILLAQINLLAAMQRWPEVRALKRLPALIQEESSHWYFAKACLEEKQSNCVESYLNPLMQKNNIKTYNYILKAQKSCREGSNESCRFFITQGLAQDPLATELLDLRYNIEASL